MDEQTGLKLMETQRRQRKRRRWLLIGLLALPILGILAGYAALAYLAEREWQAAVAEAQREDGAWRLDDLEAKREAIPDAENSYPVLVKTLNLLPNQWPFWDFLQRTAIRTERWPTARASSTSNIALAMSRP
jgi:hypothetical protein